MPPTEIEWPKKTSEAQTAIIDSTRWNGFKYRDGDVVVDTWAKACTTWVLQIVAQLIWDAPEELPLWGRAFDGSLGDLEEIFKDYRATTDMPASMMWDTLAKRYPDAPVILTVRDAEKWFASMMATIYAQRAPGDIDAEALGAFGDMAAAMWDYHSARLGLESPPREMPPRPPAREDAIDRFNAHNEWVKRTPLGRLLVFEVSQGWEPLCRFLGKAVPKTPFPRTNDAAAWRANAGMHPAGMTTKKEP